MANDNVSGADRIRTGDPLHAMQVRYQLRYSPFMLQAHPTGSSRRISTHPRRPLEAVRQSMRSILMTANTAPCGSLSTANRPISGMSIAGTTTDAPSSWARDTDASVSATAK